MFRYLILSLMLLCLGKITAQDVQGTIEFERFYDYLAAMELLEWNTPEDIARQKLTWGNTSERRGQPHIFEFNGNRSKYYVKPHEANYGYSWVQREFELYRDFDLEILIDKITLLDRDYLIEDSIPEFKWKILNEFREIEGYFCMKASTTHPVHGYKVYAWFTDQISFFGGPEGFHGLPGLILSIEVENVVEIIAKKINLDEAPEIHAPNDKKARKISFDEYVEKYTRFMKKSLDREDNPFWELRL